MKKPITTAGKKFIDLQGRHTLLHGINMVCKEKEKNYIGNYKENDFNDLKKWGFNVIRLGIFWDAAEPWPGEYNDQYLLEIDKLIEMAGKQGIAVFLDMHQDLFGSQYSDGAPDWATLTDGLEHVQTELWSESYLLSGAVQAAFDSFWNNKKAADGIGIQDHYINMWKHIASRYKENETVIGYDVINEPFMGSGANNVMQVLLKTLGKLVPGAEQTDMETLMAAWTDPEQKKALINLLTDKVVYRNLMKSAQDLPQQFEKACLSDFYNKVGRAIREEDKDTMIFLETNYFSNAGMMSGIRPITDTSGIRDKNQVFAPHGYDILVDTDLYEQSCNERIAVIFETHRDVQNALELPMLVGEWGCYPNASEKQLPQAAYLTGIFEKYLASDTYFDFSHIDNNLIKKVIIRAYPMKAAGEILNYGYHYKDGAFHCEIKEKKALGESIIYVPDLDMVGEISLDPYGAGYTKEKIDDGGSGCLIIPAFADDTVRYIKF
ncbi:MAG: cellulase family glycosylhydrolase [Lachnospiraceae bacterium]